MADELKAPFTWFGGKSRVAHLVWERFGDVRNYVEPFFGSGAVLLKRPTPPRTETVNDKDGFIANFWRSVALKPEETAYWADWPVNEFDLTARHIWLVKRKAELALNLQGDPEYCDPKVAGWWVWGISQWIGSEWCSGKGKWTSDANGILAVAEDYDGVERQRPHLGQAGINVIIAKGHIESTFLALSKRLRFVCVVCGDWTRVLGYSATCKNGMTGVFLDPPYDVERNVEYAEDDRSLSGDVREWAVKNGDNPLLRIAVCGYEGEHDFPPEWEKVTWKTNGGYGNQRKYGVNENARRERIWFSPGCLKAGQMRMEF